MTMTWKQMGRGHHATPDGRFTIIIKDRMMGEACTLADRTHGTTLDCNTVICAKNAAYRKVARESR